MKKILFLICFIALFGCSKSETIPSLPSSDVKLSHINNDDLALVDGGIQLIINKEEAMKRGVSASEYDLINETITKHNSRYPETKSENRTIAFGILIYNQNCLPYYNSNKVSGINITEDSIILHSTFSDPNDPNAPYHELYYTFFDSCLGGAIFAAPGTDDYHPFTSVFECSLTLEYFFPWYDNGVCVYEILEGY